MKTNRLTTAMLAAGLALGLTACGDDDTTTPTAVAPAPAPETEDTTSPAETTAEETTEEATEEATSEEATSEQATSEDPTEEETEDSTSEDATTDAASGSDELTAPGEELSVGDPAVIQLATLADTEDDYYRYLKLRTTVTEITEADPSILDDVQLATPIEDEVPHLVWADVEILETEGSHEKLDLYPELGAVHADGSSAKTIWADGAPIGECASEPFEELEVGAAARVCIIALADAGQEIGGAAWGGNDNADGGGDWENNPYYGDPVIWMQ